MRVLRRLAAAALAAPLLAGCGAGTPAGPAAASHAPAVAQEGLRQDADGRWRYSGWAIGTTVELTFAGKPGATAADARTASDQSLAEIARCEAIFSEWKADTELSRAVVLAYRGPAPIGSELFKLLDYARRLAEATGGAFDPTWAALGEVWDFHADPPRVPSQSEIDRARARVGWRRLTLDPAASTMQLESGTRIGLGALAKGYIVDRCFGLLTASGWTEVVVNIGGDLRVRGNTRYVDLEDPARKGHVVARIPLRNGAIATSSGSYRGFTVNGRRYHHLLDPRTGWPADGCVSVSVTAGDATVADAMATAVFILGPEAGMALVESMDGCAAVILQEQGGPLLSKGLKNEIATERR